MRKLLTYFALVVISFSLLTSPTWAGNKAGEVKDNIFTDTDNGYSIQIPDGWSTTVKKSKSAVRVVMDQKSYPVPEEYRGGAEDYAEIPTITIMADTTSLTAEKFMNNLLDENSKSKQKKFFLKNMRLIASKFEVIKQRNFTVSGGVQAKTVEARQSYHKEVQKNASSDRADLIDDYIGGSIFVAVKNGKVLAICIEYEYQFNGTYQETFANLLNTLKFE